MIITTSEELSKLVMGIIGDLNVQCKVEITENPERPNLPCVSFEDITIWAFPKAEGTPEEVLVWNADLSITTTSRESGPDTDIKDIYSGGPVLLAIQAGLKVMLSRKLEYAIEKVATNEAAKDWLTSAR